MKTNLSKLLIIPLTVMYLLLISAQCIPDVKKEEPVKPTTEVSTTKMMKEKKVNFFQRWYFKRMERKLHKEAMSNGDGAATASMIFGISSAVLLTTGLIAASAVLFWLSIPIAITAIILGSHANKAGTTKKLRANLGKGLGLGVAITAAVLTIVAVIVVTSSSWW